MQIPRAAIGVFVVDTQSGDWIPTLQMLVGALEKAICAGARAALIVTIPGPEGPPPPGDPQSPPADDEEASPKHPPPHP